jgi:hypothetical protein
VGIYAYCVVPREHLPPDSLTGVQDMAVESLSIADLGVWISRMERPEAAAESIQAHNRVVEVAATEEVTPVPLRFGQWLHDEASLTKAITEKAGQYQDQLAEFAGCMEFGLRLIDPRAPGKAQVVHATTATSGIEYMQALRESSKLAEHKRAAAEQVRVRVQEVLRDVVRSEREEADRTPHAVVTLSHLVARPHFDEYRERARTLRTMFPELRLLLSGPWPPYSFAV